MQWMTTNCGFQPLTWTNTIGAHAVTVGWTPDATCIVTNTPWTNATNYVIQWTLLGSGATNFIDAGTNTQATIQIVPWPLTNLVLTVTTTGTNLYRAASLRGPWTALNRTNYTATNPPAPYYFRGKGRRGNTVAYHRGCNEREIFDGPGRL